MSLVPSVDRRVFLTIVEALERIGVDMPAVCAQRGLDNPLDEPGERIPIAKVARVYDAISEEIADPELVYKVTTQARLEGGGTVFQLMLCCATLFEALRLVCRFSSLASDVAAISFHEKPDHVDLLVAENRDVYVSRHQLEAAVFVITRFRQLAPASRGPLLAEVWFRHAPRFPVERYEHHFGCPVLFNQQRDGTRLLRSALAAPMPGADERLQAYFHSVAEHYESTLMAGDSLQARVQRLFVQRMAFGDPDREEISRLLNISARSLHRQLSELGLSYRQLIKQVRLDAAKLELLSSERPVHEVAFLVGYADVRGFRRAFQRWTGSAPADFRRDNRA